MTPPPTPPRAPDVPTDHYTLANAVFYAFFASHERPKQHRAGREPQAEPVIKTKEASHGR